MNDNTSNTTESDEHIWVQKKSASQLSSSEGYMSEQRKEIIRQSLEFNIVDVRSYAGYKGDLLVEIFCISPSFNVYDLKEDF